MKRDLFLLSFIIVLTSACNGNLQKSEALEDDNTVAQNQINQLAQVPQNDIYSDGKTKLIKTVNYRFEVDNVKTTTDAIIQTLKKYPAYISASSLHLENPLLENKMTIRIQNEYFHELLQEIDLHAKYVNYRDVKTDDVSKDFVDLESRLKTKREVEARYMEILRKKAGTIEELLNAEKEIGSLHEEIEATISRINYLKEQVSYSTINLEFYQTITQEIKASAEPGTGYKFLDALTSGWNGVIAFSVAVTYLWPLLIIASAVLFYIRFRNNKRKNQPVAQ
jgi:hypothetical protein